jgi:hypothetical protein
MLQDSSKRQDILASAVALQNTHDLLSALESDVQNELSKVLTSAVNMPLSDCEADVLMQGGPPALYELCMDTTTQAESSTISTIITRSSLWMSITLLRLGHAGKYR